MRARSDVLELAILGQLQDAPLHGYELRKRLNATLGLVRALSYGSLYPALKSLTVAGLIEAIDTADLPHARGQAHPDRLPAHRRGQGAARHQPRHG